MKRKRTDLAFTCCIALVAVFLAGCGYAGSVDAAARKGSYAGVMSASPSSLNLGSVAVGGTSSQTVVISNTGNATVILSGLTSSSSSFTASGPSFPQDLPAGQSIAISIGFAPKSSGATSGTVTLLSNASNAPTSVAVSGTGNSGSNSGNGGSGGSGSGNGVGVMAASPSSLNLGSVAVGSSSSQNVTVSNSGSATVIVSGLASSNGAFGYTGPVFPMNLPAGQSFSFKAYFSPGAAGAASGTMEVLSNASNAPTAITVSGTGTGSNGGNGNGGNGNSGSGSGSGNYAGVMTPNPASLNLGTVSMGNTASQTVSVSNTGNATVILSGLSSSATAFAASGPTFPMNLSAGQSVSFTVVFTPKAAGAASGSVTLASNASNAPTSISVSGTGSSGSSPRNPPASNSSTLTPSTSTLSFGSVSVGTGTSLPLAFTNDGSSSVTVSSVSVAGSGFTASGVSSGQVIAAGQTASLNVTFDPASSGSLSGSVTLNSNATNSPATVSLSGTGAATQQVSSGPTTGAPTCGVSGDTANHIPADWQTFVPPAKGQSYVDPTFGCTVTRITDSSTEDFNGSVYLPLGMGYATVSTFNENDSYLMIGDGWGRRMITDLSGNPVVAIGGVPNGNDGWYLWDATSPNTFYWTSGNSMMKGVINGSSVTATTVHQFTEYSAINFMDETDVSQDGAHVVIIGGDTTGSSPENVFDYNFQTNLKGPVYTTTCTGSVNGPNNSCLHKLIQTADNNVIIQFANDGTGAENGNRLWTGATPLPHLQNGTNHLDAGYDLSGNSVFIEVGNNSTVTGETNPCPSGWGLDVRQTNNPSSAVCLVDNQPSWHVGYRGNANQPWVGLSFFDQRLSSPEFFDNSSSYVAPSSSSWLLYEDEVMLVRVDANNNSSNVYRLARGYSRSDEDFNAQPHASISRDGKYIAFGSDMAYAHSGCPANSQTATGCSDVYIIKVH